MLFRREERPKLEAGASVRVKPREDILKSLDLAGTLDGCLFTEQMQQYCGRTYRVSRVVRSYFSEHKRRSMRPRAPVYLLESLFCDGNGGHFPRRCDHGCQLLWHEEWLEDAAATPTTQSVDRRGSVPLRDGNATCQLQFIDEVGRENSWPVDKLQFCIRKLRWYKKRLLLGLHRPVGQGDASALSPLAIGIGDRVRVRSRDDIGRTLDRSRKTGGCTFQRGMFEHCGREFRVFKRVDYFFDEAKQSMRRCKGIFLLEESCCDGSTAYLRPCDRNCFYFWHWKWLEKA